MWKFGDGARLALLAPDGQAMEIVSYADSGVEAVRLATSADGAWETWVALQQDEEPE